MLQSIDELQSDILNPNIKLTDLLRKSYLLATNMNFKEMEEWIIIEQNGYKKEDELPAYRKIQGPFQTNFGPCDDLIVDGEEEILLPVVELEYFLETTYPGNPSIEIKPDFFIPKVRIRGILDSIRNKLLQFVLKLITTSNNQLVNESKFKTDTAKVFIIHGHDEINLLKLESLLKDEFSLIPIVLKSKAGRSRSLIEKFEQEAQECLFAFALITPDDMVQSNGNVYPQARPNVIFELGWFYGKLGRENVCILF